MGKDKVYLQFGFGVATQGPSWGHFKSLFNRELVNFWQ